MGLLGPEIQIQISRANQSDVVIVYLEIDTDGRYNNIK